MTYIKSRHRIQAVFRPNAPEGRESDTLNVRGREGGEGDGRPGRVNRRTGGRR